MGAALLTISEELAFTLDAGDDQFEVGTPAQVPVDLEHHDVVKFVVFFGAGCPKVPQPSARSSGR
jgi:hypothetical protein